MTAITRLLPGPGGPIRPVNRTGLLAQWAFIDGTGRDYSGFGRNLTLAGSPPPIPRSGLAIVPGLLFDGANSHADSTLNPTVTAFYCSVWCIFNAVAGGYRVVANDHTDSTNNGFQMIVGSGNQFTYGNGAIFNGANVGTTFVVNKLYNIIHTFDANGYGMYVNGVSVASGTGIAGPMTPGSNNISLGFNPNYLGDFFPGIILDVQVGARRIFDQEAAAKWLLEMQQNDEPNMLAMYIAALSSGSAVALFANSSVKIKSQTGFTGSLAVSAISSISTKARPSISGAVPLLGRATVDAMSKAQASARAAMAGKSTLGITGTGSPRGALALSATATIQSKGSGVFSGVVALAARTAAMLRATGGIGTGGLVALAAHVALMAKAAGVATGKAALAASTSVQAKATTAISGRVGLLSKTSVQTTARAGLQAVLNLTSLTALTGLAVKARAGLAGKVGLSGATKLQATASGALAGSVGLSARTSTVTKAAASATYRLALSSVASISTRAKASAVGRLALFASTKITITALPAISGFVPFVALAAVTGVQVTGRAVVGFITTNIKPVAERTIAVSRSTLIALQRALTLTARW